MELLPQLNKRNKPMNAQTMCPIYRIITIVKIYYKLNEKIEEEHDCSNDDIQSDTGENVIDIDYHVTVITSRKVHINKRY